MLNRPAINSSIRSTTVSKPRDLCLFLSAPELSKEFQYHVDFLGRLGPRLGQSRPSHRDLSSSGTVCSSEEKIKLGIAKYAQKQEPPKAAERQTIILKCHKKGCCDMYCSLSQQKRNSM